MTPNFSLIILNFAVQTLVACVFVAGLISSGIIQLPQRKQQKRLSFSARLLSRLSKGTA